eukprot:1158988-Pelagomonas_calceolata.AAC.14
MAGRSTANSLQEKGMTEAIAVRHNKGMMVVRQDKAWQRHDGGTTRHGKGMMVVRHDMIWQRHDGGQA